MAAERSRKSPPGAPSQSRGHSTRQRILESAEKLYLSLPSHDVSVAAIAAAAGVFPNQVTYYFGSKDSLLIHAAFLALLHDAERVEAVGNTPHTPSRFCTAVARTVLLLPSLPIVVRALAVGASRDHLAPVVNQHLDLLFRQSERYLARLLRQRGWDTKRPISIEVRTFWSAAFGAVLLSQAGAAGTANDLDLAGTLTVHEGSTM